LLIFISFAWDRPHKRRGRSGLLFRERLPIPITSNG
jgi:hypothetical protein